jgi:hypothetical protein
MTHALTVAAFPNVSNKLRELLGLLAAFRDIREPLTSPDGLRASLELLLRLAEFAGMDRAWTDRVRAILDDPRTFDIVLAIVRYLHGLIATDEIMQTLAEHYAADNQSGGMPSRGAAAGRHDESDIAAQDFVDWLPLILEIISLLRDLRRTVP